MATYQPAAESICTAVTQLMKKYHGELFEAKVTCDVLYAHASRNKDGVATGPAIKVAGKEAAACVRICQLKERAAGRSDFEITIDGDRMGSWSKERLFAILDHELEHVELKRDKKQNAVMLDDLDRPALKLRYHDHEFGWFDAIARRHRKGALEIEQASEMFMDRSFRQLYLPGMKA